MKKLLYLLFLLGAFTQVQAQNNTVYGAGISYTNGTPSFTPPARTSRVAIDTITGKWYHFNTPGGWQLLGNTIEEIAGCSAPAYTPTKGDSKIVINNCTEPELYYWTGSVWVWINQGTTYTAGAGIRIESNSIILDSLYILRFRTGSNTDGAAGTMSWNATEETVDLVTDQGAVTGHLMESAYYNTRNTTGTPITIGRAVMAAGTTGNTGRILIAPAIADGTVNSEYILGITAQTIGNNANGKVQHFGKIRGIQTNGANFGETWVDDDVLFCSAATPGYLTKVQPAAPNLKVPIATVIHAHPSNGTLFIRPSHFPDLNQINDVQLTSPTTGQTLIYNSVTGVWSNQTPADPSSTNELQTLSTGTNTLTLSNGGGTVTVDTDPANDVTGSGTSGQVSFWTGAQTQSGDNGLFWNNTDKRLGVGLTTPQSRFHVVSSGTSSSTWTAQFHNSAGNNNALMIRDDGRVGIGTSTLSNILTIAGSAAIPRIYIEAPDNTESATILFDAKRPAGNPIFSFTNQGRFIIGNGIGFYATSGGPSAPILRSGSGIFVGDAGAFDNTSANGMVVLGKPNNFARITTGVGSTASTVELIGTHSPTSTNIRYNMLSIIPVYNQTGTADGAFVGIDYNPTIASLLGRHYAATFRSGSVGIGTSAPNASAALDVTSTTQGVLFPRMTTTQRNAISSPADGLVIYNTTDNKLQVRAAGAWVDLH
jgi:hypothetical protein